MVSNEITLFKACLNIHDLLAYIVRFLTKPFFRYFRQWVEF